MLFFVLFAVLTILNFRAEAVQDETNSSVISGTNGSVGFDAIPLLRKMISDLEDLKIQNQLISDKLERQAESLQLHDQRLQRLSTKVLDVGQACVKTCCDTASRDCSDIKRKGFNSSGVYRIYLNNIPRDVYCDFNTPGGDWLVFQRRRDGSVDFYRNYNAYANGFGNVSREFWLGNEILYQLTSNRKYKLRIDMEDFDNQKRFAEYSSFSIGPSSDYYRLKIGTYSGNAGDSMIFHNNQQFSTYDVDRDMSIGGNCALVYRGAWWYAACHRSNLNGKYLRGNHSTYADGVEWYDWHGHYYSLKTAEMKIALLN